MATTLDEHQKRILKLVVEGKSLFVTGKAGTGKTTLLKEVVSAAKRSGKEVVVLAPTGVAAKNASGVTIHAFTHMKTEPYIPLAGRKPEVFKALDDEYVRYLKKIDVIIIDEVSMVRCDVMDALDATLRYYRGKKTLAFGGTQVVLFGDLYQLMPVADDKDAETLDNHYKDARYKDGNYYFFNSDVIKNNPLPMIELEKIYRQGKDKKFAEMLNRIRVGGLSYSDKMELDKRYDPDFDDEDVIRLTTHNKKANKYNDSKLNDLRGTCKEYKAQIKGIFPNKEYPTPYHLELKKGARVMFVKNDTTHIPAWYINGTLATVKEVYSGYVKVRTDDGKTFDVTSATWQYEHYTYSKTLKKVVAEPLGSFTQLPLRLAWAVTIHKSQGLTFDRVAVDAGKSFAHGQVYVALSRCKTLQGLTLVSKIDHNCVTVDPIVVDFMNNVNRIATTNTKSVATKTSTTVAPSSFSNVEIGKSTKETFERIRKGHSIKKIAKDRRIEEDTVYRHIAELIEAGELEVSKYVGKRKIDAIMSAIGKVGDDKLSPIKSACTLDVSYPEVNMVRGHWRKNHGNKITEILSASSIGEYVQEQNRRLEQLMWQMLESVDSSSVHAVKTQSTSNAWEEQKAYLAKLDAMTHDSAFNYSNLLEKQRREQQEKEERERRLREEAERKAKLEEEKRRKAELEAKAKEEEQRKKAEEEKKRKKEEEKRKRAELRAKAKAEEEKRKKEAEEKERLRKQEERAKRLREEAEWKAMLKAEREQEERKKEEARIQLELHEKRMMSPLSFDRAGTTLMTCYKEYKGDVIIPSGVESVFADAFKDCKYIKNIVLPDTVTTIGNGAFKWCGCTKIVLPDSVNVIEDYAFKGCMNLHSISIPASVTSLGREFLSDCTNITDIYINVTNPSIYSLNRGFIGLQNYSPIVHVPNGYLDNYLKSSVFRGIRVYDDIMFHKSEHKEEIDKNPIVPAWTVEDDQTLKELADGGLNAKDIADLMNRSVEEVAKRKLEIAAAESKMNDAIQEKPKDAPIKSEPKVESPEMDAIEKALSFENNRSTESATGRKLMDNEAILGNFIIKKSNRKK